MRLFAIVLVSLPLATLPCPASAARAADPVALVRRGLTGWNQTTTATDLSSSSVQPEPGSSTSSEPKVSLTPSSSSTSGTVGLETVADADSPRDTLSIPLRDAFRFSEDSTHQTQTRTIAVPPEAPTTGRQDLSLPSSSPSYGQPRGRPSESHQHVYFNSSTAPGVLRSSSSHSSPAVSFLQLPDPAAPTVTSLSRDTAPPPSSSELTSLVYLTFNRTTTAPGLNNTHSQPSTEIDECSLPARGSRPTTYSIIYTATTTFYGDPAEYTPPFSVIETPVACITPTIVVSGVPDFGETEAPGFGGPGPESLPLTTFCITTLGREACATEPVQFPGAISVPPDTKLPGTVTFVTTDKNPSVVFSPVSTPNYGKHTKDPHAGDHHSIDGSKPQRPHPHGPGGPKDLPLTNKQLATTTFKVTLEPTKVVIEDQTFSVLPTQTTRVTVSDETFIINPTQVIGGGSIINRPWNGGEEAGPGSGGDGNAGHGGAEAVQSGGGDSGGHGPNGDQGGRDAGGRGVTMAPVTTTVGKVPVMIAPAGTHPVVVVDGTTYSIPPHGKTMTAVVQGTTITIDPTAVHFPSETIPIRTPNARPVETEHVVVGGQMITAIGQTVVVIHETTITYGPGISARTEKVDGGTITIGPSGVVIDEKTIGGPKAGPKQTAYEIVGGVTITQIGASVVVIEGSTWTIGPEAKGTHTTEVGGKTIVIAPEGVTVETLSFTYPFGPTVVTTIMATPSQTVANPSASQTQESKNNGVSNGGSPNGDDDDEGSGTGLRGALSGALLNLGFCISIGVWHIMGHML